MSEAILEKLDAMTAALVTMAKMMGTRLSTAQMCEKYGKSDKTILAWERAGKIPKRAKDGKWLLSEVIEMEARR